MDYKWIGAVLIILGCGGYGFSLAANQLRELLTLRQLIGALEFMSCELRCRMTALPEVCRQAGQDRRNVVGKVLLRLGEELDTNLHPDVSASMESALSAAGEIPPHTRNQLQLLGRSLGRFDLEGQLAGLESVRESCRNELERLSAESDSKARSCRTLGLCAGAALAILLV